MDKTEIRRTLDKAREEIECGDCEIAYDLLMPQVNKKSAEALYLFSMFAVSNQESIEDFEKRSVSLLIESAKLGYAPAQFTLGLHYESGDLVSQDKLKAALLFKAAAQGGYAEAKLNYGLDLYYGTNGIPRDVESGLEYIEMAARSGLERASETLSDLKI